MHEFNLGLGIYAAIITISALHYITKLRNEIRIKNKLLNFQKKILEIQAEMIRKFNV